MFDSCIFVWLLKGLNYFLFFPLSSIYRTLRKCDFDLILNDILSILWNSIIFVRCKMIPPFKWTSNVSCTISIEVFQTFLSILKCPLKAFLSNWWFSWAWYRIWSPIWTQIDSWIVRFTNRKICTCSNIIFTSFRKIYYSKIKFRMAEISENSSNIALIKNKKCCFFQRFQQISENQSVCTVMPSMAHTLHIIY